MRDVNKRRLANNISKSFILRIWRCLIDHSGLTYVSFCIVIILWLVVSWVVSHHRDHIILHIYVTHDDLLTTYIKLPLAMKKRKSCRLESIDHKTGIHTIGLVMDGLLSSNICIFLSASSLLITSSELGSFSSSQSYPHGFLCKVQE